MKKLIFLTLISFLITVPHVWSQNLKTDSIFNWGKTGWELPADMVSDPQGNFYIAGSFSGEMAIGKQLLKSVGKRDIFLAKFSSDMQLLWAKNLGGLADDNAYSLLCSGGKLYLAGSFRKQIDFNNGAISLQGKGLTDVFVAQLEGDGTLKWAKALTSAAPAQKAFLQADSIGNIWIAGSYAKPIDTNGKAVSTGEKKGIYLAGFDVSGQYLQSQYFTGSTEINLNGFNLGKGGAFYFAGSFSGNMEMGAQSISSNGKTDGFLASTDKEGKAVWIENLGGAYDDEIKSMALDNGGNIYIAGEFKYEIKLDKTYTAPQNTDAFVVKYNPNGKISWSSQLGSGGESYNTVTDIEMADNGKFFLSGAFRGKIQSSPEVKSLGNSKNAFLARFGINGQKDWVLGTGSMNENKLWINYSPKTKGLFVSGYFSESFKLGDFELKNQNYKDIFFGSLVDCDLADKVALCNDTSLCTGIELDAKGEFPYYLWNNGQSGKSIQPLKGGQYSVQATDKHGCQSSDTVKVQLLTAPSINLGKDATICQGKSIKIEAPKGFASYQWDNDSTNLERQLSQTGNYWLKVTDSIGCAAMDTINLTVNALPEFELGGTIELPATDSLTLDPMLAEGNYVYQWSTGHTGQSLKLTMQNFAIPTIISLRVTDQNQCSFMDNVLVKQGEKLTTIDENTGKQDDYNLYPNPSKGVFHIMPPKQGQAKLIEIYNLSGKKVKSIENIQSYPVEVDLGGMASGNYLVKVHEGLLTREFRVVVE